MPLSKNEIQKLVEKIRKKYIKFAAEKSPVFFNVNEFEKRLDHAVSAKMDLEPFILAEITNFEKIKEKYELTQNKNSFSDKVDKIIEEQIGKMKNYPCINFNKNSKVELPYLYGALNKIYDIYVPAMYFAIKSNTAKDSLFIIENNLKHLADMNTNSYSKAIEDVILVLAREGQSELELEKHQNAYIKECGFMLHKIIDFCSKLIESRDPDFAQPLSFNNSYINKETKKIISKNFEGLTGFGVILELKELSEDIIDDFRLSAFRKS